MLEIIFLGILGVILGSFSNALIYRVPRGISWIKSKSSCPNCGHQLGIFELIPLLSYMFQKGQCRSCRTGIGGRYWMVECLFGVMLPTFYWQFGWSVEWGMQSVIWGILLILFFIDWETYLLPAEFTLPLMGMGVLYGVWIGEWWSHIAGLLMVGLVLIFFRYIVNRIYAVEAFGLGDVMLGAGIGALLGVKLGFLAVYFGFVFGGVWGLFALWAKRVSLKSRIAFGPTLIVGAALAQYLGANVLLWVSGG